MSKAPTGDTPEEATILLSNGEVLNIGDRVVIIRLYRNNDEVAALGITDETMARFMGSHVLAYEGETIFDGTAIPLIEVELEDGKKERVWGFECDWMDYREFLDTMQIIEDFVPDYPEI